MRSWTIAFSFGVLLASRLPMLPPIAVCQTLVAVACLLHWRADLRLLAAALLGASWLGCYGGNALQERWTATSDWRDVWVEATVQDLPTATENGLRVRVRLDKICRGSSLRRCNFAALPTDGREAQISLYEPLTLNPGQRWRWALRLRPPHGFVNPGGFDYEAWLLQQRIAALGYLRVHPENQLLEEGNGRRIERMRWNIAQRLQSAELDHLHWSHLLRALTIGDGSGLSDAEWSLLAATGTTHLLVISGSHVALIAMLAYRLACWLATRSVWLLSRIPAQGIGFFAALGSSWVYAGLAGFTLPVLRAWLMIAILLLARLWRRQVHHWQGLCLALAAVLAFDPLAVLNPGFWLSFAAVAVLLQSAATPRTGVLWRRWLGEAVALCRLQWCVGLALLPIVLLFFQQTSLLALAVNLPLIPLLGVLVVPLALSGTALLGLWPALGLGVLQVADVLLGATVWLLKTSMELFPAALVTLPALTLPGLALLVALVLAALLLRNSRQRWLATAAVPLALLLFQPAHLPRGTAEISVLDVGQGLAVLVVTEAHALLYDAGPRFSSRLDAGEDVVVPVLRRANLRRLDRVLVSHSDSDHAGGLAAVQRYTPGSLYSGSDTAVFGTVARSEPCRSGQRWTWDDVQFQILHPDDGRYDDNNSSCVLLVTAGEHSVLLAGDIGSSVEKKLLRAWPELRPTVVVAPHHGSKSSSSWTFVGRLQPDWVVYSSGFQNRYGHPSPEVEQRYRQVGAMAFTTALDGAARFTLTPHLPLQAIAERDRQRRFWRARADPAP